MSRQSDDLLARAAAEADAMPMPNGFDLESIRAVTARALRQLDDGDPRPYPPSVGSFAIEPEPAPFSDWPSGRVELRHFEDVPPSLEWFVEGRMLSGRAHLVSGLGGSGKTRFVRQLAVGAVTGGVPWGWTIARTGSALLFLKEDTPEQIHRALYAMGRYLTPEQRVLLCERLRIFPMAGLRAMLLALEMGQLHETAAVQWLLDRIAELPQPVVFVGIDPAIGVSEGDELSQAHARRLGELMDSIAIRSGACVALTAHASKGILSLDEVQSHSSRGAGALTDAVRGEFTMRVMTASEGARMGITDAADRKRYVQLVATKGNELPSEAYAPLWLQHDGDGMRGVDLGVPDPVALHREDLAALAVLERCNVGGDSTLKFWREQCVSEGVISSGNYEMQKKTMLRVCTRLIACGRIEREGRGLYRLVEKDKV